MSQDLISRRAFCGGVLSLATLPLLSSSAEAARGVATLRPGEQKSFTILHTNDQHGHLLPFSYQERLASSDDISGLLVRREIGGIARRAALMKKIKATEKNVHLIDCGDWMDGTPFSTEFFARADVAAMNLIGYEFATLGNHDYNMSVAQVRQLVSACQFPLLLANVYEKATNKPQLPPFKVVDWDGLRVALFAVLTYSTRSYPAMADGFTMREPQPVAAELVPKLREMADIVICISHLGLDEDMQMAREVPGIDIILGSHSHTRLPVGGYERALRPGQRDPKGTVIVQAHQFCGEVGRLEVGVMQRPDGRWDISQYKATLLPLTEKSPEDKQVAAVVGEYWNKIKPKYAVKVGEAKGEFSDINDMTIDATNYYLVADAVSEGTGVQFDLENRAGVRAALLKGTVTLADVIAVDPFDNDVYTFKIKGADLKRLLVGSRPSSSSRLRFSLRQEATGNRWTLVEATLDGKPIEEETVYTGATNAYFYDRFVKPISTDGVITGKKRREYLLEYIRKHSPLVPKEDGRNNFGGVNPMVQGATLWRPGKMSVV